VTDWQAMIDKLVKVADGGGGAVSAADMDRKAKAADREQQLQVLADEWAKANPGHSNTRYTLTDEINGAAYHGNSRASGLEGGG